MPRSNAQQEHPAHNDNFLIRFLPGSSDAIMRMRESVYRLNTSLNQKLVRVVLIQGESGCGKNHVARVVAGHRQYLARNPHEDLGLDAGLLHYVPRLPEVSLTTLPDTLVESELFGHKKGSFTGADRDKKGYFAEGYMDLLLDEIGDASLQVQKKLLTVLETGKYRPVGGQDGDEGIARTRILLATHQDLRERVRQKKFREDLYWRANEYIVSVPSLREQADNIPAIIALIEDEIRRECNVPLGKSDPLPRLSKGDMEYAQRQPWPGNIRQLRHSIKRWLIRGGTRPFPEIVECMPNTSPAIADDADAQTIREHVSTLLDRIASGETEGFEQPSDLTSAMVAITKQAVVAWYDERRPDPQTLSKIFRRGGIRSIRNVVSKWRGKCSHP